MGEKLFCSFCGKSQHEVRKMIAGPGSVFICNECVELCSDICSEGTIKKWAERIAAPIIKARRWLRGSGKERTGWGR